jgi:hypothetical protein
MSVSAVPALKEWSVIWRALLSGEQIIDIRKGGLREDGRHFSVQSNRFWLYPTVEHQKVELLKPAYARWVDDSQPPAGVVRLAGWAEVVGVAVVTEPDVLDQLDGKVIWTRDYVESRFSWKRRDPLQVLALRAHRLAEPIDVPLRDEHVGCTSWVDIEGLPTDPAALPGAPALSDVAFDAKRKGVADLIPGGLAQPPGA